VSGCAIPKVEKGQHERREPVGMTCGGGIYRKLASLVLPALVVVACGSGDDDVRLETTATTPPPSTAAVATTISAPATGPPTTATESVTTFTPTATEAPATTGGPLPEKPISRMDAAVFDDVLTVWNGGGTGEVTGFYAPDARVIDIETVAARGLEEIEEAAMTSRETGHSVERIAGPEVVFEKETGAAYAIAPVQSHRPNRETLGSFGVVVLDWSGTSIVTHWRLLVPEAAQGDYLVEDDADAIALASRMIQAWTTGDTAAAREVYGAEARVHWWGEKAHEGLDEILEGIEGADTIGNVYEDITTPTVVVETISGRKYAISVVNVTGMAHPNGSLVISVAEVEGDKVISWTPFYL
jgi:hypothetical protein